MSKQGSFSNSYVKYVHRVSTISAMKTDFSYDAESKMQESPPKKNLEVKMATLEAKFSTILEENEKLKRELFEKAKYLEQYRSKIDELLTTQPSIVERKRKETSDVDRVTFWDKERIEKYFASKKKQKQTVKKKTQLLTCSRCCCCGRPKRTDKNEKLKELKPWR